MQLYLGLWTLDFAPRTDHPVECLRLQSELSKFTGKRNWRRTVRGRRRRWSELQPDLRISRHNRKRREVRLKEVERGSKEVARENMHM